VKLYNSPFYYFIIASYTTTNKPDKWHSGSKIYFFITWLCAKGEEMTIFREAVTYSGPLREGVSRGGAPRPMSLGGPNEQVESCFLNHNSSIHFCCTDSLLMTHRGGLSLSIIIWRIGRGGPSFLLPWGPNILLAALHILVVSRFKEIHFCPTSLKNNETYVYCTYLRSVTWSVSLVRHTSITLKIGHMFCKFNETYFYHT